MLEPFVAGLVKFLKVYRFNASSVVFELIASLFFILSGVLVCFGLIHYTNSVFFLSLLAVCAFLSFSYRKDLYLLTLCFFIIFNIRGELFGFPVQAWEAVALPIFVHSAINTRYWLVYNKRDSLKFILAAFCFVSFLSGLYNWTGGAMIKSLLRWFEFFCLYLSFRYHFKFDFLSSSIVKLFIAPFLLLLLLSSAQFFIFGPGWLDIMASDIGGMLYGVDEVANRLESNNYIYKDQTIRAMGVYISPPALAFVCGMVLIVLFYSSSLAIYKLLLALPVFIVMLLTMGRSGLLYMLVSLTVVNVMYKRQYMFVLYSALGLALAMIVAPIRERLFSLLEAGAEVERVLIWETMLNIWKSSPIFGVGGGQIPVLFNSFASVDWLVDRQGVSHSAYFGILAEYGILGLSLYALLIYVVLRSGFKVTTSLASRHHFAQVCLALYAGMLSISADLYQAGNTAFVLFIIFVSSNERHLSTLRGINAQGSRV
ncbi:O-antigen ligase family protein [Teredinibacter haidensis]|uniref:O-antigen ligase family protein n=1 Tax=Teredinibacter haidensis TaxID=2731755 RepID=UPI0009488B9E|nr:O-antigen ligase family protein [Teredinibacter haidensis]